MTVLRGDFILLLSAMLVITGWLKPAYGADFEPLDEIGIMELEDHLQAMGELAPQLRTQLRSVRMEMKFDVREIHNIERSIGNAQTIITRLLAMHKTDRVNPIRAHFMMDDLRRKAETLNQGLSHITQRIRVKYQVPEQAGLQPKNPGEEESLLLLSLLEDYTRLVNQSFQLVSGGPGKEASDQVTQ